MDTGTRQPRDRLDALAVGLIVVLCALWGLQQVAAKLAVNEGFPPVLQATLRSAGAAVLCCAWVGVRQGGGAMRAMFRHDRFTAPGLLLALIFGGEFALLFYGLRLTTASRGVLFLYTSPFFTALGVHLLVPAERLRLAQVAGLLVAFAGVAVAFADGLWHGQGNLLGDVCCALAAVLWGCATVLIKTSPGVRGVPAARLLVYQLGGSVPVPLLASLLLGEEAAWPHPTGVAVAAVSDRGGGIRELSGVVLAADAVPGGAAVGVHLPDADVRYSGRRADPWRAALARIAGRAGGDRGRAGGDRGRAAADQPAGRARVCTTPSVTRRARCPAVCSASHRWARN